MSDAEVFIDTFEPDSWANAFATNYSDKGTGLKHNFEVNGLRG